MLPLERIELEEECVCKDDVSSQIHSSVEFFNGVLMKLRMQCKISLADTVKERSVHLNHP